MKDWKKVLISENTSIREAIKVIDEGALQIALVVEKSDRLLGTITDGDVRRGILKGIGLEEPAALIMNTRPIVARVQESREEVLELLRQKSLHQVPVLDHEGCLVGLEVIENLLRPQIRDNLVVIMAGGLGSRLAPMTNDCPKPMLLVGGKPILETIIENFLKYGFRNFCLAVNYKAEMIKAHFGDGTKYGCEIHYLNEVEPLGTAGALSLLPKSPELPIIVINGDVLTKVDFSHLLEFHAKHNAAATMCVREYDMQVPYGVVLAEEELFKGIKEKPIQKFFVNAGIYVLEPETLRHIPEKQKFDMTNLFDLLQRKGLVSTVFPVMEYWMDLGHIDELKKAQGQFGDIFK